MGNPKLIPYETIVRATSGEPEAVEEVLRHYSKRIRLTGLGNIQPKGREEPFFERAL